MLYDKAKINIMFYISNCFMQQKLGFQLKSITLCLYIKKAREQIEPFSCLNE